MPLHLAPHRWRLRVAGGIALLVASVPALAFGQQDPRDATGLADSVARAATAALLVDEVPAGGQESPAIAERLPAPAPAGFVAEPRVIGRAVRLVDHRALGNGGRLSSGVYPEFSNMIAGAGWIAIGPGYRHWLFGDRAIVDASTAISWRAYKMGQARFELTRLARSRIAIGSQVRWQDLTQVTYFGEGPASVESDRSEYRMKSTDVVGYATVRPIRTVSIVGRLGGLQRPTLLPPGGTFERGNPYTQAVFPDNPVFARVEQPGYLHGEASISSDTRNLRGHPSSGGLYRAAWSSYADRDSGAFSFRRYEAEAAQFIPLPGHRVVLAVHGWVVGSETGAGEQVPFYLMPTLGGGNTLRSYADYRLHDRNLLLITAESRVALMTHVDLALFVDAGNVAPRVSALNLDKRSYGLGFRLHSGRATFARVDLAHGAEGWRFLLRTTDPLDLSRLSRRTAAAPFVP